MIFLLLPCGTAKVISDEIYHTQQVLVGTTTFINCIFDSCQTTNNSDSDFGALFLDNSSAVLKLLKCLFASCRAEAYGGALVVDCRSCSMSETFAFNCSANYYAFCLICSSVNGALAVFQLSVIFSVCSMATLIFDCDRSSGSPTCVESLNSSMNQALDYASGFYMIEHFNLSLRFSTLSRNTPANCLFFADDIRNNNILCLTIFNNSCQSDSGYVGFILVRSTLTLSDCTFQSNTFDYFLGTYFFSWTIYNITFIRCVFDFQSPNKTNRVSFTLVNCARVTSATFLSECVTQSRTRSNSPTTTCSRSQSPTTIPNPSQSLTAARIQSPLSIRSLSPGAIAGIVIAGVVVLAVVVAAMFFILRRRPTEVNYEGIKSP